MGKVPMNVFKNAVFPSTYLYCFLFKFKPQYRKNISTSQAASKLVASRRYNHPIKKGGLKTKMFENFIEIPQ